MASAPIHLTVEQVFLIHDAVLREHGGSRGLRDSALLKSAVAAPQATFGGKSVFADLVEVAAAYLFYLCKNHAFVDGNKRVALASCLLFSRISGLSPAPDGEQWEALVLDVAASWLDREQATQRLRALLPRQRRSTVAAKRATGTRRRPPSRK